MPAPTGKDVRDEQKGHDGPLDERVGHGQNAALSGVSGDDQLSEHDKKPYEVQEQKEHEDREQETGTALKASS